MAETNAATKPTELEKQLRQQALLAEAGRRALSEPDFDLLLEEACRLTAIGLETTFCKILEYLPEQNRLLLRAGVGWHKGLVGHATIEADLGSAAGYALHTGKAVISNSLADESRFRTPGLLLEHGVTRALNVILIGEGRPFGVLEADSDKPGVFSEHDVDFLQAMSNLLGLALERSQSHQVLQHLNDNLEERISTEVAERRQVEMALEQARKMEAVGQLTGGVAHDFNNFLLVIAGNLEIAARTKAVVDNPRLAGLIETARKATTRGAQLTAQLLAFARRQPLRPEIRAINDVVREFEFLATRMLGDSIAIDMDLSNDAGAAQIDAAQLGSALLNLIINARDAMPQGGKLTVRTRTTQLTALDRARHPEATAGEHILIEVNDTGTGMPPDVLQRATEPFFTTKAAGKGTGFGLSQVYGFVRQSLGFMDIISQPARGTSIKLYLPRTEAAPDQPEAISAATGANATILVVEDDAAVRELLLLQLDDLGYRTLDAANGPDALALLDRTKAHVDLILTDMIMPGGMSGINLVREAQARRPGLKAILSSGYMVTDKDGVPGCDGVMHGQLPLLPKPYLQSELGHIIAQTLLDDQGRDP